MADPLPCPGCTIRILSMFTNTSLAGGPGRFSAMKMANLASPSGWRCRDQTQSPQFFAVQINFKNRWDQAKRNRSIHKAAKAAE
jgi:hypothetical protein